MACRNAYKRNEKNDMAIATPTVAKKPEVLPTVTHLLFGVHSEYEANDLLQNNIDLFEWATRNKIYPNFWGRYILGENALTAAEIRYLHDKGCRIAALCRAEKSKSSEEAGKTFAAKVNAAATALEIPEGTAIYFEIDSEEVPSRDYLRGFASTLVAAGYTPAFKANTDAKYAFDREFSRGMQTDKDIFDKCLIWATAPILAEYDQMTTSHLIHPDNWKPFAPSAIQRKEIALWQYGKDCHPIYDDADRKTVFHLDLVRNPQVITEKMF